MDEKHIGVMIRVGTKVRNTEFSSSLKNLRTTNERRNRGNGRETHVLFKLIVSLCCISGARSSVYRNLEQLKHAINLANSGSARVPSIGHCDFEESCDWLWNRTGGFVRTNANFTSKRPLGPFEDSNGSKNGHFLWMHGPASDKIWSKTISETGARCRLQLWMHHVQMSTGTIQLIIETNNQTSTVAEERFGNDNAKWFTTGFNLGVITQFYRVVIEVVAPDYNSSVAIDNIRLVDCFPEAPPDFNKNCTADMFCCNNGSCLNKTRVCDLTPDCADGEDEMAECDKMPETAKCNFEHGWCGWTNVADRPLNWTLYQGPTFSDETGPGYDHTYRNVTGTYASAELPRALHYGSRATIDSPIFNPTPPYSNDPQSPFFHSCQVRFFYHQYGTRSSSLALYLVHMEPHRNDTVRLWWNYGNSGNLWYNKAIPLPEVRYRYFFQFEASKGYYAKVVVAIDDFSLSRECFGIGVPPDVVKDFNYYSPVIGSKRPSEQHADFVNETVVRVTTCGATGRIGPTVKQCAREYNKTDSNSSPPSSSPLPVGEANTIIKIKGIQRWTAPRGGYYTLIGLGARGGRGSLGMGSTLGAMARGVIELEKGETLYFLVGQPGSDACPKSLGSHQNQCQQTNQTNLGSGNSGIASLFHEVKNMKWSHGGGGGGGATYVFTVKSTGEYRPVLVAAGGGGLGAGRFNDDGTQHGRGPLIGTSDGEHVVPREDAGGHGGSWNGSSRTTAGRGSAGLSLVQGGLGGQECRMKKQGQGDGGFGGGGGGCKTGGGGGGFIGGNTGHGESGNGEGGYSYVSPDLLHASFRSGTNQGPGEVSIIPDISGCDCDFRCVALDLHLSETKCLCPPGWQLGNDSRSCLVADESNVAHQTFMIVVIVGSLTLLFALSALCVLLYNRYQSRKALLRRRHLMFGPGTELRVLERIAESMMTEFNPNYEFAGNLCSIKDLPQIPRDSITFVKPLGQGAFGEVFQGVYKYRRGEEHPVAVKTLPPASTRQAVADFMMEALIMSKFNHPNIVLFVGISFDKHPRYIILELLAGGDLKNFLREERPRPERSTSLTMVDLVMCAHDVANGCKYMETNRFIHRDIAARNCLLTCKGPGRVVKIADFGMARDIYRSDYYKKGGKAMLPVKWMPPESFIDGIFSTKTDVWAFGVLLWEIMSFGYMPYTGCANREVMSMVTTGGRLERPAGCPDPIYGLMTRCWHPNPDDRPSFATILERIGYCLQDPDVINYPMPNHDILPPSERDQIIMRPDPETECINVHADLDGFGYMQPRAVFWTSGYRMNTIPGVVYASLRHGDERDGENVQETTLIEPKQHEDGSENTIKRRTSLDDSSNNCQNETILRNQRPIDNDNTTNKFPDGLVDIEGNNVDSRNLNSRERYEDRGDRRNGNGESTTTTDTNSDSLPVPSSTSPPETVVSSPNTRTSSPSHGIINNVNGNNINGIIRKSALKAALSLDPSTLYRGTIPYEKIAFSTPPPRLSNPGSVELRKDSLSHELPREEECSC